MRCVEREITKEDYEMYMVDRKSFCEKFEANIPIEWECGYGYYGASAKEKNGKYYVVHHLGNSCD